MRSPILLLFLTPALSLFPLHASTSQRAIDSLVDRAYYILTSAEDPGSGLTPESAIAAAGGITAQLRALAGNDPNRGYILGKAKEIEEQIYLEKKGLLLEKEQFRQKNLNDRIAAFNSELGKRRPSLRQLDLYREEIAALDPRAGGVAGQSMKKRAAALALEVSAAVKAYLDKGVLDSARADLVYCETNRDGLRLTPASYAELEAKVSAKMNGEDERALVKQSIDGFKSALEKNDLTVARRENGFIDRRMLSLRGRLVPFEWKALSADYDLLRRKLEAKQDSMVDAALLALRKSGPAEAERHLAAMHRAGVSPERIGLLDRTILETVMAQKRPDTDRDSALTVAIEDTGSAAFALQDMVASAKKRAAEKKDSVAAATTLVSRSTHVEEVRRERLRIAYDLQQLRSQDRKKTEKELAFQELVAIYRFLELRKSQDAYQKLLFVKSLLRNNIPLEDYGKVTAAVEEQVEQTGRKQGETHGIP